MNALIVRRSALIVSTYLVGIFAFYTVILCAGCHIAARISYNGTFDDISNQETHDLAALLQKYFPEYRIGRSDDSDAAPYFDGIRLIGRVPTPFGEGEVVFARLITREIPGLRGRSIVAVFRNDVLLTTIWTGLVREPVLTDDHTLLVDDLLPVPLADREVFARLIASPFGGLSAENFRAWYARELVDTVMRIYADGRGIHSHYGGTTSPLQWRSVRELLPPQIDSYIIQPISLRDVRSSGMKSRMEWEAEVVVRIRWMEAGVPNEREIVFMVYGDNEADGPEVLSYEMWDVIPVSPAD